MSFSRIAALTCVVLQIACTSATIIRDRAYAPAVEAYQLTDTKDALDKFPSGERAGFITSVEKGWLSQWAERWDAKPMQKQVDTFDERRFISITREAGTFLFQESEEGYVPSEHEVIILHLVSAAHYAQKNQNEDAKVELRRAGYILDRFWDDPALRIWLGSLWCALGDWNEAQVDFRRSATMTGDKALLRLSESSKPPAHLALHFYGNGPRVAWNEGQYQPTFLADPNQPKNVLVAVPTLAWFKRHTLRNSQLRDLLVKSNFMAQYLGSKTMTYAEHGIVKTSSWTVRTAGILIGTAIVAAGVYLAIQNANSGEALQLFGTAGVAVGGGIWAAGEDIDRDLTREIRAHDKKNQEDLRIYRMVRFMPTWIALNTNPPATAPNPNTVKLGFGRGVEMINHF